MKLETAQIIATASPQGWSQVHRFFPEKKEKKTTRGTLVAVINLTGLLPNVEVSLAGREVIARIHEEYYGDLAQTPFKQLKQAVTRVYQEISQEAKIEIIGAAIVDKVVYLASAGSGKVLLYRQEKISPILTGVAKAESIQAASGYLQTGDLLLLATSRFFALVSEEVIQAALLTGSASAAAEMLRPLVLAQEEDSLAGACLIQLEAEEKEEVSPVKKTVASSSASPAVRPGFKLPKISFNWLPTRRKIFSLAKKARLGLKGLFRPGEKPKRSNKSLFLVALILLVVLGLSLFLGQQQRQERNQAKKITSILSTAQAKKEEAEAILSLNQEKAKQLLDEAEIIINQAEPAIQTQPEIIVFRQELQEFKDSIWRDYQVSLESFFDLELIKKDASANQLVLADDQLFVLDQGNSSVYQLGIKNKKTAIIAAGENLKQAKLIATINNQVYLLAPQGVLETSVQNKAGSWVTEEELDSESLLALTAFGSNLYQLNQTTIWVYPATETGFGTKRRWLENEVELVEPVAIAIDGSIWVLQKNGQVLKLTRGSKEGFYLSGWDQELVATDLFTSAEADQLYLLDQAAQKVIVFSKSGEYDSSYHWSETILVSQLVVNETEGKIFLLSASKVYQLPLK